MARVLWDEFEVAILIDYFNRYRSGKLTRSDAISAASAELRERGKQKGIEVDDIFRNENGIALQMTKIEDILTEEKMRLNNPSQVFEKVIDLYLNDKSKYEKMLNNARNDKYISSNVKNDFFDWLAKKISAEQLSELYFVYPEIEKIFVERKILTEELFETKDVKIIETIISIVNTNKALGYAYARRAKKFRVAINYYYEYLKAFYPQDKAEFNNKETVAVISGDSSKQVDCLIEYLKKHEVVFVDNRDKGGCLWIEGEAELNNLVKFCKTKFGADFRFKSEGAIALGGKPGWWTRWFAPKQLDQPQSVIKQKTDQDAIYKKKNKSDIIGQLSLDNYIDSAAALNESHKTQQADEKESFERILLECFPKG